MPMFAAQQLELIALYPDNLPQKRILDLIQNAFQFSGQEFGNKLNINRQYMIQSDLLKQYQANKNSLQLMVDIKTHQDYMSILSYYAGDC